MTITATPHPPTRRAVWLWIPAAQSPCQAQRRTTAGTGTLTMSGAAWEAKRTQITTGETPACQTHRLRRAAARPLRWPWPTGNSAASAPPRSTQNLGWRSDISLPSAACWATAPTNGRACRPGGEPPASPAGQQPGQQVPASAFGSAWIIGRHGAAGCADCLGGDEVSLADQPRMRGPRGDDPAVGQVPPLHLPVPQGDVGRVGQLGVGPLPVPRLPPGAYRPRSATPPAPPAPRTPVPP